MKKATLFAAALISTFLLTRCSKSSGTSNANTTGTQWSISGKTYKGLVTTNDDTTTSALSVLTSSDASGNNITLVFAFDPTASWVYTVTNGSLPGAGSCLVSVGVFSGGTYNLYTSTGKTGDHPAFHKRTARM